MLLSAFGAGFTWGARRDRVGRPVPEPAPSGGCALVTGASRGIGAAIARALAPTAGRSASTTAPTRAAPRRSWPRSSATAAARSRSAADVADPGAPDELFNALESHFDGPVLALVNNAGISRDDLTPSLGDEEWDAVIETDLTAAFRLTRRALKPMLRARSGRIVNISSVVALRANPGQANYAAAKAGLIALTQDGGGRGRAPRDHGQRGRARAGSTPR